MNEIPAASRRRYAAGKRIRVPRQIRSTRDIIRRHLREEQREMRELAAAWDVKPATVKTIMRHGRPLAPQHLYGVIALLGLDEFDALELHLQGAIEAGWQLEPLKENLL